MVGHEVGLGVGLYPHIHPVFNSSSVFMSQTVVEAIHAIHLACQDSVVLGTRFHVLVRVFMNMFGAGEHTIADGAEFIWFTDSLHMLLGPGVTNAKLEVVPRNVADFAVSSSMVTTVFGPRSRPL